ncbi:MAG: hypothetical protein SOZ30_09285, partial [Roseburia lenta]|nr:hypothetical protein [Roseburia lenta]
TAKEADGTSFTIGAPENSGELTVTVNKMRSLNDKNNNASKSNLDSDGKFDNRYIRVWDVGHYFSSSLSGYKPTMAADKKGNLFSTWTSMGSALVTIQKNLKGSSKPAFVSYDQPDKESWISVDKSSDEGNISMIYMPAHVGSSGRGTYNCYADSPSIGGAWGTGIPNDITDSSYYAGFRTDNGNKYVDIKIDGNPYTKMDKTKSAGFQLASYAMRRDVSQFTNGRSARYTTNMHFAYYDTKNKALRYTYQPVVEGAEDTEDDYKNKISGWILIDGQSDGQDRIHKDDDTSIDSWNLGAGTLSTDKKEVTFTNTPSGTAGNTLGISYESKGGEHKLDLFTVVSVNEKKVTFTGDFTAEVDSINGGAIYRGDSNVVEKGSTQSSSAGSYLALDVTNAVNGKKDSGGKPVIVYYDAASESLRIAYSTSATPSMTVVSKGRDTWTRQAVSITNEDAARQGGTYVQARIDGNNYLHIVYRDGDGKLCYLKSTNAPDGGAYTFDEKKIVDNSGTYATISVIKNDSTYVPCISWLNSEGTANGVKYALLRDVDIGAGKTKSLWDVQIVPAVVDGGNHYVSGGEFVYVEGKSGSWNATEDSVSMADCDAVVGFNTGRMDVVFLKSEK